MNNEGALLIMKRFAICCLTVLGCVTVSVSHASTSGSWAALDKVSDSACVKASGFRKARVAASIHFSDAVGMDARIVSGIYPQAHMNNAHGRMLCLYSRKTGKTEVQELPMEK